MGRREILIGISLTLGGAAIAAIAGALLVQNIPAATYVLAGGVALLAVCSIGLFFMFRNAPKAAVPLTASEIGVAVAAAVNVEHVPDAKGRDFLAPDITPRAIQEKIKGRTELQIAVIKKLYEDKYLRVTGTISGVSELFGDIIRVRIRVLSSDDVADYTTVIARFSAVAYEQMLTLNLGEQITVVGRVTEIALIYLDDVEIEELGVKPLAQLPSPNVAEVSAPKRARKAAKKSSQVNL